MPSLDFGKPVPVAADAIPAKSARGGRTPVGPAMEAWLAQIEPGTTYELASTDKDGAHGQNRVTSLRKVAGDKFKVETRTVEPGKRYRIFVTAVEPTENGDAKPKSRTATK